MEIGFWWGEEIGSQVGVVIEREEIGFHADKNHYSYGTRFHRCDSLILYFLRILISRYSTARLGVENKTTL